MPSMAMSGGRSCLPRRLCSEIRLLDRLELFDMLAPLAVATAAQPLPERPGDLAYLVVQLTGAVSSPCFNLAGAT